MEQALEVLGLHSLHDVTPDSLKQTFKAAVMNAHPDKGGKEGDFDAILSAYVYIAGVLKRSTGGRDGMAVLDVGQVRQAREEQFVNELNNLVNEVMDHLDAGSNETFRAEFNAQFEKHHVRDERGYGDWLKAVEEEEKDSTIPSNSPREWNTSFEARVRQGKPAPHHALMLPEQMARSCHPKLSHGTLIPLAGESFTSNSGVAPSYTDLHDAYTVENTVLDKLPQDGPTRTFEQLLEERGLVYQTELDRDLAAIDAYEKQKQEEEKNHKNRIAEYFKTTASSQWALRPS